MDTTFSRTPYPYRLPPLTNISGFSYRDGVTYLGVLEHLRDYIQNTFVPEAQGVFEGFHENINAALDKVAESIQLLEDHVVSNREEYERIQQVFVDEVRRQVEFINNKTGAVDIQRVTLTANYSLQINPLWPTNHPVEYVFTQDATGGRKIVPGANISGPIETNTAPGSVTRLALVPLGNGKWFVSQSPATLAELQERFEAIYRPDMSDFQAEVSAALAASNKSLSERLAAAKLDYEGMIADIQEDTEKGGFLFAAFVGNGALGENLNLFYSPDGKTIYGGNDNPVYIPSDGYGMRDPSVIYRNNRWYVAYTTRDGQNKDLAIASSTSGHPGSWSLLTKVSVASVSGLEKAWAPEFVVDGDDVYLFFSRLAGDKGSMYYVKASNTSLSSWGSPVKCNFADAPAHYIDGVPVEGGDGKWYMFYSTGNTIDRAVASSVTGQWVVDKSGNWAGWGTGIEGPTVVKDGDVWRVYFDKYLEGSGLHYSDAPSLNGPWAAPLRVSSSSYALEKGQSLRHGSVVKLSDPVARNKVQAALMLPRFGGNHSEWQNPPGIPVDNDKRTVMRWVVPDTAEMVNPDLVDFVDGGTFTLNEYAVYSVSLTGQANGVTGVNRAFVEMTSADGVTIHARQSSGPEDKFSFSLANFKPRAAGEKFRFYVYLRWSGPEDTASVPIRVRITKVADV